MMSNSISIYLDIEFIYSIAKDIITLIIIPIIIHKCVMDNRRATLGTELYKQLQESLYNTLKVDKDKNEEAWEIYYNICEYITCQYLDGKLNKKEFNNFYKNEFIRIAKEDMKIESLIKDYPNLYKIYKGEI